MFLMLLDILCYGKGGRLFLYVGGGANMSGKGGRGSF